ncbi:hypothetical protein HYT26_04980 [Candidatus Pacearchaeota archaeon]|nr:hypothetical protein [Candidatus Pacearchaeota archaeon]
MNEEEFAKEQLNLEKHKQDIGFLQNAHKKDSDSVFTKHLDASDLLQHIEKLLMGYEYDSEEETYKPLTKQIIQNDKVLLIEQGAILDPNFVRLSIGYLQTFLNSNVFLSYIESIEQINAIMWDVNVRLTRLLHPLKNRFDAKTVEVTYAIIENSIYFAVNRAYKKNTLDALTKSQHSIEHLGEGQKSATESKKEFKIFGF